MCSRCVTDVSYSYIAKQEQAKRKMCPIQTIYCNTTTGHWPREVSSIGEYESQSFSMTYTLQ